MAKPRKPSAADIMRLGADVAEKKAKMDPKLWKQLVKRAHAQGFTVAGQLSGAPPAMRERSQSGMKAEAQKSVDAAYAPALKDIDTQESRVNAWDAKRKADNAAYTSWLQTQTDKIMMQAAAADQALVSKQSDARMATTSAWEKLKANAATNATAAGTVSDASQSTALGGLEAEQAKSEAGAASAQDQVTDYAKASTDRNAAIATTAVGWSSELEGKRNADISTALASLRDKRTDATIKKAADYLGEFSKMKDQQLQIAQYNTDMGIARERLGIEAEDKAFDNALDAAGLEQDIADDAADNKTAAANARSTAARLRFEKAQARAKRGEKDLNADGKIDAKDLRLGEDIKNESREAAKAKYGPSAPKPNASVEKNSQAVVNDMSRASGQIKDLYKRYPKGKSDHGLTLREIMRARGWTDLQLDVAFDIRKNGGRMSPAAQRKAKQLGILSPETVVL